jgi:non-lysosomal glucosylceramidase
MLYEESEHQELLFRGVDLSQPLDLHIPSALGPLDYFVCLRIPSTDTLRYEGGTVHAQLTGLRSTDITGAAGDGIGNDATTPSLDGKVWYFFCRLPIARGDGTLTFKHIEKPSEPVDLLLCTWRRFVDSGQADDLIRCQSDPRWAPSGVPLGGIGTGKVEICRDGRFRNFSGNNNQDMPFEEPDGLKGAYLALEANDTKRLLATRPMAGIAPCEELQFDPAFPQATLTAPQAVPGLDAAVRLSGPLAPHDVRTSSLPAVLIRWQLTNTTDDALQATCTMGWPNLIGSGGGIKEEEKSIGYGDGFYQYWSSPDAPSTEEISVDGVGEGLVFTNQPSPISPAADGRHLLLGKRSEGVTIKSNQAENTLSADVEIGPGQTWTVDMLLLWEMPNWVDTRQVNQGLYWQNHFADGPAIADELLGRFDEILQRGGELKSLMEETTLPQDIQSRLLNCCYPLVTNSILFRDGRFSINEGPTEMAGCYGTIDQRLGAHAATQLFFPELNATELGLFADVQDTDGAINHDLGGGHLDKGICPILWPDLCCSFVIQHARHAWTTGDKAFAQAAWPKVKKAIERHGRWADEGNGIAQLGDLGTSYDSYHYIGTTAYMGTLWMAALKVARKWALQEGDESFMSRIDAWLVAAEARLEEDLWNGEFYRAYASPGNPTNENSHAGMLAGQFFTRLLTGEDVLPRQRLASCAEALMNLNCSDTLTVPADEAAPEGGAGSLYGWLPYIEAFALTACMQLWHERAYPVWRKMIDVMQGTDDSHPCDTRLMYRPQNGELSWGAYYMTAPASWLVYEAMCDFTYLADEGLLRFAPPEDGTYALIHPRFWALGTKEGQQISIRFLRLFGEASLALQTIETALEAPVTAVNDLPTQEGRPRGAYRHTPVDLVIEADSIFTWQTGG